MTPQAALIELLARVGARNGAAVFLSAEELSQWPAAAVTAMKSQRWLAKARPAVSVVCPGCEQECVMPVNTPPRASGPAASFIVCDKRSDINRVPVTAAQLTQWRCDSEAVCSFIAASLGLRRSDQRPVDSSLLNIGIMSGEKRRQMLCLKAGGDLTVVVGKNAVPMADLINFRDGAYSIDRAMIRQLVDAATAPDPRYTPSNARREVGKLETQARYAAWQKAYRSLRKRRPQLSDMGYARQIGKLDIAEGRDADTIRKHMKP